MNENLEQISENNEFNEHEYENIIKILYGCIIVLFVMFFSLV